MDFNLYQMLAWRTRGEGQGLDIMALGLAGESGEVADLVKKHLGHGHPLDKEKMKKELGDVLWYIACAARLLELPMEEIAEANIAKLKARYPEGFSTERSLLRYRCDLCDFAAAGVAAYNAHHEEAHPTAPMRFAEPK